MSEMPGRPYRVLRDRDAAFPFLMAPPSVADMFAVSDAGETMPQKSTYFYPKVPTGLVLWRWDELTFHVQCSTFNVQRFRRLGTATPTARSCVRRRSSAPR